MKTFAPRFAYFLAAIFLLAGCAGHPRRQVTVAIFGVPATVAPNQTFTITAMVNNDKTTDGVTWTVTGAGTFTSTTSSLTYTAPPSVPANPTVVVMATSISTPTSAATATFNIATAALSVQITNPVTTVTAGGANVIVNATVTNDVNNQGVSWDLFTAGTTDECSPSCGTIVSSTSTSATYMPPATVPSPNQASLVAISVADNTQSATDTFTIQGSSSGNLGFLMGNYAIELGGFDQSGNALTLAGSITSDGNGNITSSEFDVNDNFGTSNVTTLTGTYTLDSNLRGIITLNQPLTGFSETPTFAFTIDAATNNGVIISADSGEQAVSGLLAHQSVSSGFTPSGSFIFRGSSDAANIREGEVGQMTIAAGGAFTGLVDQDDIGEGARSTAAAINGTFSPTDGAGRGTFSFNGGAGGGTIYAYYALGTNGFFIVENDDDALFMNVGVARFQNLGTFNANSPNGVGAFGIIGGDNDAGEDVQTNSSVAIGQLTISGGNTASVVCDLNDEGDVMQCDGSAQAAVKKAAVKKAAGSAKPAADPSPIAGTVTFDPTTGRGTITFPGGYGDGFVNSLVFYLEQPGAGVILDTTPFVEGADGIPEALVGDWIPQTSTSDVAGQIQGVGLIAEVRFNAAVEGEMNVQGSGQTTGLFDASAVGVQPLLDASLSGNVSESDGNGRSTASLASDAFPDTGDFAIYEVNPSQFFFIGIDDEDSPLGIFTPQALGQEADAKKPVAANGVTSTKPAVKKAAVHHGRPRPNAAKPTKLPAR